MVLVTHSIMWSSQSSVLKLCTVLTDISVGEVMHGETACMGLGAVVVGGAWWQGWIQDLRKEGGADTTKGCTHFGLLC
jgi:hypothetical protein